MTAARILLIIGGGIACYKCLDLIRRLKERGHAVVTVMTPGAQEFIRPLAVSALSNERVFTKLFDVDDEREIGHIRLTRQSDVVVVAPATANLIARMAHGLADDLATATLLANDKPLIVAPAMNPKMWSHQATQRNLQTLRSDGAIVVGPEAGEMAEKGEAGVGRLVETATLVDAIETVLRGGRPEAPALGRSPQSQTDRDADDASSPEALAMAKGRRLEGRHVVVTAGPTHEPIDPVRYIANRSSGKQGYAIAAAAAEAGARVTLVSGPVALADPQGVKVVRVETANEMLQAVRAALPADIGVFCAAVADWRVADAASGKLKKSETGGAPRLELMENPDILRTIAGDPALRPQLVVGFAAETDTVIGYAQRKLTAKKADWIVANDVSDGTGVMGGDRNRVHLVRPEGVTTWPDMTKHAVARRLVDEMAAALATATTADGDGADHGRGERSGGCAAE